MQPRLRYTLYIHMEATCIYIYILFFPLLLLLNVLIMSLPVTTRAPTSLAANPGIRGDA